MNTFSRREFFKRSTFGLAAAGAGGLILRGDESPTEASGDIGAYGDYLKESPTPSAKQSAKWSPTETVNLGPFYREGAPYRAKITPPLVAGTVLVIRGRVWAHDTRKPLPNAVLDIWQANSAGRYDNDDPENPPAKGVFENRARLITDESGYYEFETIHPGAYQISEGVWRPSHIHYFARATGYRSLVTQLYFKGDRYNATDGGGAFRESLCIAPRSVRVGDASYESGEFDIVLARV